MFLGAACGGGGDDDEPTPEPTFATTETATAPAETPPASTATATPSASPTATPAGGDAASAIAAALEITGGREVSPLTAEGCLADNPDMEPCLELTSDTGTVAAGLAFFRGGYPDAGPFQLAVGRTAEGGWQVFFASQQQAYQLTTLPGSLLSCSTDGPLIVRAEPSDSAEAVAEVERGDQLSAAEFRLTNPGAFGGGQRGHGWYRVTSPAEGWVESNLASAADLGDCALRDAIEGSSAHG